MGRKKTDNMSITIRLPKRIIERINLAQKPPSQVVYFALSKHFADAAGVNDPNEEQFIELQNEYGRQESLVRDVLAELRAIELQMNTLALKVAVRAKKGDVIVAPSIQAFLEKHPELVEGI